MVRSRAERLSVFLELVPSVVAIQRERGMPWDSTKEVLSVAVRQRAPGARPPARPSGLSPRQ